MGLGEIWWEGVDLILLAGSYELGNEAMGSITSGEFLD
jgi:hypothetical protein